MPAFYHFHGGGEGHLHTRMQAGTQKGNDFWWQKYWCPPFSKWSKFQLSYASIFKMFPSKLKNKPLKIILSKIFPEKDV